MPSVTVYSSLLFLVPSYYGYMYNHWLGNWAMALAITSVINHSINRRQYKYKSLNNFDKVLTQYIVWRSIHNSTLNNLFTVYLLPFWLSFIWAFYVYILSEKSRIPGLRGELYHCTIHVAGSIASTCLLFHNAECKKFIHTREIS
jgi:hypothetical protein